jgi:hypothetical protein
MSPNMAVHLLDSKHRTRSQRATVAAILGRHGVGVAADNAGVMEAAGKAVLQWLVEAGAAHQACGPALTGCWMNP